MSIIVLVIYSYEYGIVGKVKLFMSEIIEAGRKSPSQIISYLLLFIKNSSYLVIF